MPRERDARASSRKKTAKLSSPTPGGVSHLYRLLRWGQPYTEKGAEAYEKRYQQQRLKAFGRTAKALGYEGLIRFLVEKGAKSGKPYKKEASPE